MKSFKLMGFMFVIMMFVMMGCSKDEEDKTESDPIPVPVSTVSVYVTSALTRTDAPLYSAKNTSAYVEVIYAGSGNFSVSSVKLAGVEIPYDPVIRYYLLDWDSTLVTGSNVKLEIVSSLGTYSVSGALPAVGSGQVQISVPDCLQGSYLTLAHN